MALPSGFAVPPLADLAVLAVAALAVAGALARERPAVSERTALAFAPWMALGSTLYVCYQLGVVPAAIAPFASAPAVYVTTFVAAGAAWLLARRVDAEARVLAGIGLVLFSAPVAVAVRYGTVHGTLEPVLPAAGAALALVLTAACWVGLRRWRVEDARVVGYGGALVVFGHALDAVTTAVGVDLLGFREQTPLSRAVLEFAKTLPTAPVVGSGWLFVALKLALAVAVVVVLADYVRDRPTEGYLLLAFVAAVGLGPGTHNFLLFAVTTP